MPGSADTRKDLWALVGMVTLGAAVMMLEPREPWFGIAPDRTLLFALAAFLVACRPVRVSRLKVELVPFHPFVLIAIALTGTRAAAIIAVLGILAAAWARNPRPAAVRLTFNLGSTAVAASSAGMAFLAAGGKPEDATVHLVAPLAVAAVTYFLVSTALVAAAIAMESEQPYFATWRRSLLWTVWSNVAGASIAIAGAALFAASPVAAMLVMTAPCWILVMLYRAEAVRRSLSPVSLPPA